MSVSFDPTRAALRLDAEAFITLTELSSVTVDDCDTTLGTLVEAGVVTDGVPHPVLRPGLAAVSDSTASLQVLVAGPEDVRLHHGWLSRESALLTDLGDGTYDFAAVTAEFVPESIARLTRLVPRPRLATDTADLAETVVVDEAVLDDLASNSVRARTAGGEALADLLMPWPAVAAAVRTGTWRLSLVDVTFADGGRTIARRLAWVDTDAGTLRVEVDEHGPVLVPATTTELWRAVVAILSGPVEPRTVARSA